MNASGGRLATIISSVYVVASMPQFVIDLLNIIYYLDVKVKLGSKLRIILQLITSLNTSICTEKAVSYPDWLTSRDHIECWEGYAGTWHL